MLVGLWNVLLAVFLALVGRAHAFPYWGIVGILQISYGIWRFTTYGRYQRAFQHKPAPEDVRRLDDLVKKLQKTKSKTTPDVLTFRTTGFFKQQVWKGQLGGEAALFIDNYQGHDVLVARKEDVTITVLGKVFLGSGLKATFRIGDRRWQGLISPDNLAKYEGWKSDEAAEVEPAE